MMHLDRGGTLKRREYEMGHRGLRQRVMTLDRWAWATEQRRSSHKGDLGQRDSVAEERRAVDDTCMGLIQYDQIQ